MGPYTVPEEFLGPKLSKYQKERQLNFQEMSQRF